MGGTHFTILLLQTETNRCVFGNYYYIAVRQGQGRRLLHIYDGVYFPLLNVFDIYNDFDILFL